VFQRRTNAETDFYEKWNKYKDGIETPEDPNFWLGTWLDF